MNKPVIPKQHGAYSMLLIPFLFGVFLGEPKWGHLSLFITWVFFYLATYPFLMSLKLKRKKNYYLKWAAIYFSIATLAIIYPLITEFRLIFFGLAMVPFFLINMYFSWQKNDRALMNDFVAILVFAIGGLTSYFYGTGSLNETAWELFGHSIIYFVGTAFFVKTMIREKRNVRYKIASWTYHVGLIPVFLILQVPLYLLAYIPSIVRSILLYGKNVKVKMVGIVEIVNAAYFFVTIIFIYLL